MKLIIQDRFPNSEFPDSSKKLKNMKWEEKVEFGLL